MTTVTEKPSRRATALAAWGDPLPDWIEVLDREVARTSIRIVADTLGIGKTVVGEILSRKYKGRIDRMEARVRGAFLGATVDCPVLGADLARDTCMAKQKMPFAATNPERIQLYRTCPTCPNYRGAKKAAAPES